MGIARKFKAMCFEFTALQSTVICITAIVLLYQIIDEHIAKILDAAPSITESGLSTPTYRVFQSTFTSHSNDNTSSINRHHSLYFANDLALHPELIGSSYSDQLHLREERFHDEMDQFIDIARDLLNGDTSSFHHLSRYYVHPSKYKEFTREYMLSKWNEEKTSHISESDLVGAHPLCPRYTQQHDDNLKSFEIWFSHNCCTKYGPAHFASAQSPGGFDTVLHYEYNNISDEFKHRNFEVLENGRGGMQRGAGYWLWKPWIILNTMVNEAKECDVLCYCDAGAWWNNSALPLLELASSVKYGVMVFSHLLSNWGEPKMKSPDITERLWSKRDAMLLLGMDIEEVYDTVQRKATFSCYQVNPDSIHFVSEWLYHAMDPRVITDNEGVFNISNLGAFVENRHDQTVMSLLSKKYGIPAFVDPSQYGWNDAIRYGTHILPWDKPWIIKHTRGKQ